MAIGRRSNRLGVNDGENCWLHCTKPRCFIADKNHKVEWLDPFGAIDYREFSYDKFIQNIGTVVMVRNTFDFVANAGVDWPYAAQRSIVITSSSLQSPFQNIETYNDDLSTLIGELRKDDNDTWIVGGGRLQSSLIAQNLVDEIQVFVMPVLIGDGIPMWPGTKMEQKAQLIDAMALDAGVVHLQYKFSIEN